jgi:hypothetical protein
MATGLALVVLFLIAVILLLLIDRAGLKAEIDAKDSLLAALRASHDEVQDIALRALRGDFERRTDR